MVYTLVPRSGNQVAILDARTGAVKRSINYQGKLVGTQVTGNVGVLMIQEVIGLHGHVYNLDTGTLQSRFQAR